MNDSNNPLDGIFGRELENGHVALFHESGEAVTRLDVPGIYPVGSWLSTQYEHPKGIVLDSFSAFSLGIDIEA